MTVIDAPMIAAPRQATPAAPDWAALSNTAEWVNGEPVEKPVSEASCRTELWISGRLFIFTLANPIASVYPGTMGYQVFQNVLPGDPNRIRKPDASVIRTERIEAVPEFDPGSIPIVPDLAVEVVSPNDVWSDLAEKVREYQAAGFPLVWIADPNFRTVMVHAAGADPVLFTAGQTITAESALPGFACLVSDLFPPPRRGRVTADRRSDRRD